MKKDKVNGNKDKNKKKPEIKWLKFQPKQNIKICLSLDLYICHSLKKFKILKLWKDITFQLLILK